MPLTQDRNTPYQDGFLFSVPVAAGVRLFAGALLAANATGFAVPGEEDDELVALGRSEEAVDNTDGEDGDLHVLVRSGRAFRWKNSALDAVTQASLGRVVYIEDDETVSATSNEGARSVAGVMLGLENGEVWVFPALSLRITDGSAITSEMLASAAVTGSKIHADALTSWIVDGEDATGGAEDLAAVGAVAGLRIVSVIDLTTPAVVNKATISAGVDKFVQSSGNLDAKKLLIQTLPA